MVITGASSGIGQAIALGFARQGARLTLAARGAESLEAVRARCEGEGARAVAVPTDVTDEEQVRRLADTARAEHSGIDVWVNNAGVIHYGRVEDTSSEAFRRVIETNLFGQVHGARAALPHLRRSPHGLLVNMASVWGRVPSPYVAPYVTSKFALRAFSACLRQELRGEQVDVVTILPQAADTPIFEHAGNHSGRAVAPVPPLETAEHIAESVLKCVRKPRREVTLSRAGRLVELAYVLAPGAFEWGLPRVFELTSFRPGDAESTDGNLFAPSTGRMSLRGGWDLRRHLPRVVGAGTAGLALAAGFRLRRHGRG